MVKPKPISDSDVRITDIKVRSALIRVRWNDMPVRREASSVLIVDAGDLAVTSVADMFRLPRALALCVSARVSFAHGLLPLADLAHVATQEVIEERSDHRDRAEAADRLPARADRGLNDVGGKL